MVPRNVYIQHTKPPGWFNEFRCMSFLASTADTGTDAKVFQRSANFTAICSYIMAWRFIEMESYYGDPTFCRRRGAESTCCFPVTIRDRKTCQEELFGNPCWVGKIRGPGSSYPNHYPRRLTVEQHPHPHHLTNPNSLELRAYAGRPVQVIYVARNRVDRTSVVTPAGSRSITPVV